MTNERHEKALEAAVHAFYDGNDFPAGPLDRQFVTSAIAAYLQAMDAVIVPKEPVAWRWRFKDTRTKKWTVQKNKPDWYKPIMSDVELEPLFAPLSIHFTNGE